MDTPATPVATIGDIARRTGAPIHRIQYLIRARAIEPLGRVGNLRVFSNEHVRLIAEELDRLATARSRR